MILTGKEAVEFAEAHQLANLGRYADSAEGARDVTIAEAREIASEDPALVWLDTDFADDTADNA